MASTRRLEIFQDPTPCANTEMPAQSVYSLAAPLKPDQPSPVDPLSSNEVILHPPGVTPTGRSPLKTVHQRNQSPPKGLYNGTPIVSFPPPQPTIFTTDSPMKRQTGSTFQPTASSSFPKAVKPSFPIPPSADKENFHPTFHSDNLAEFPDPNCDSKVSPKRKLLDTAPLHDRQQSKKPRLAPKLEPKLYTKPAPKIARAALQQIPEPQDLPSIDDNGSKPPYSYASLIGMSILRAPSRRLTLAQIYKWISDSFSYYHASDARWQNSIRHNLSLNKAFIKQERPKDDPGKGNYWAIEPGMEMQFVKDKPSRRPTSSSGPSMRIFAQPSSEANLNTWPRDSTPATKADAQVSDGCEPSSDATIPASDAASHEDDFSETINMPPPSSRLPLSSPLQLIHSSPPVAHHLQNNDDMSPIISEFPLPSSRSSSRKRNFATLDDSGYFSSLNSSVTRPYHTGGASYPEVGGDRKRIRRGRAEEEIARIRSSPHDISPSKGRSYLKQPTPQLVSSSPLRNFTTLNMFPPLTPAVTFKIPPKPPASISPNTNLRNHRNKIRELVGSPLKTMGLIHDEIPFSPAFTMVHDENCTFNDQWGSSFDIFADNELGYLQGSPTPPKQQSVRHQRFDRASKIGTILADVTGNSLNSKTSASGLNAPILESPTRQKSGKPPTSMNSYPVNPEKDDVFGLNLSADEESDDFDGLDLLQGFQKIGGNKNPNHSPSKAPRPLIGARSHASRF